MAVSLIQSITANGGSRLVSFNSIPQTYTHLYLIFQSDNDQAGSGDRARLRINTDSADTNMQSMYNRYIQTSGRSTGAENQFDFVFLGSGGFSNYGPTGEIMIINYASTSLVKGIFSITGVVNTALNVSYFAMTNGQYNSTTAISSIHLWGPTTTSTWASQCIFTLYGIS
jgi:hypothetical protein